MSYIYWSGMSYDEYLAHHGILGQKWGRRRFQNPDGTLTPEGRKRYGRADSTSSKIKSGIANGAKVAGRAIATGAAAVGRTAGKAGSRLGEGVVRGVKTKLAEKMPFMLNDEEIVKYRERLNLENTYRNSQANRRDLKKKSQGDQFIKKLGQDIISSSAKTVASKATNKWIDELLKSKYDKQAEEAENKIRYNVYSMKDTISDLTENNRKDSERKSDILTELNKLKRDRNKLQDQANDMTDPSAALLATQAVRKYDERIRTYGDAINQIEENIKRRETSIKSYSTAIDALNKQPGGKKDKNN